MVRRAKLKTRKSTLGATKDERDLSAKESLAAVSVYGVDNGKKEPKSNNSRLRLAGCLLGGLMAEDRDEIVSTSITNRNGTSSNRNSTSCSITTRGSLLRDPPPTQSPSSPKRTLNFFKPLVTRTMSRPRARANSPSKPVRTNDAPLSSAILPNNNNTPSKKDYVERVELVSMKNEEDLPFVRIYVSKTSYKQRTGDGTEVIAKPNTTRQVEQRKKWNDWNLTRSAEQKKFVNDWNFVKPRDFDQGIVKPVRSREALKSTMTTSPKTSPKKRLPPILKTMDTKELQMCDTFYNVESAINRVTACHSLDEGPSQPETTLLRRSNSIRRDNPMRYNVESAINRVTACHSLDEGPSQPEIALLRRSYSMRRDNSMRAKAMTESMNYTPTFGRKIPAYRAEIMEDDINAPNYYGIHSLRNIPNSTARRKAFSSTPDAESIEKILATREKEKRGKEEKKQRKIQNRLDKKAKKLIKKEVHKPEVKRKNSFDSSMMKKVNFVDRPIDDNKLYSRSYEENVPKHSSILSSSSSEEGFIEKLMGPFSKQEGVPRSVSFVSDTEDYDDKIPVSVSFVSSTEDLDDPNYYNDDMVTEMSSIDDYHARKRNQGKSIEGVMSGIGNALLDFGNTRSKDMRDLRMVDSDISISAEDYEDYSSESSSAYYYTHQ